MFNLTDFLVKRSKKEHSAAVRTVATLLGATLFIAGIPGFIFWIGSLFAPQPILPASTARAISVLLFIIGVPWVAWAVAWQLIKGKGTPVPIVPTVTFLKNGPYRYMRNPMMMGFFLYVLGWALFWDQWGFLLVALGCELLLLLEIKFVEEPELAQRFGQAYEQYKKETPFMIPRFK